MRAVNLLPREGTGERSRPQAPTLVGVIGAVLVTGILCATFLGKSGEVAQQREALQLAQAELAAIPPPPPVQQAEPQFKQARDARLTAVSDALGRRMGWDGVLRRFSQVLPDDVWLTSLSVQSPLSTGGSGAFLLTGYSYSHDAVARLLSRLAVIPDLEGVQLQRSEQTKLQNRRVVTFSVAATLRSPEAPA